MKYYYLILDTCIYGGVTQTVGGFKSDYDGLGKTVCFIHVVQVLKELFSGRYRCHSVFGEVSEGSACCLGEKLSWSILSLSSDHSPSTLSFPNPFHFHTYTVPSASTTTTTTSHRFKSDSTSHRFRGGHIYMGVRHICLSFSVCIPAFY